MNTDFLHDDLQRLDGLGIYRTLKTVGSPQGREIILDGKRVLNFCSNDYLGLANDARIKTAALEAIAAYGFGSGASRLVCGNMSPHERLEEDLAHLKKTESALLFSSGYMANAGIIPALMDHHSVVLSDRLNHASIVEGIILSRARLERYPHADMQALELILKGLPAGKRKMIVTDTVFSMDGDKAPLKEIVDLAGRYEAMIMVDEAHAFGVLGKRGGGLVEELGLQGQVDVQMGTLSKAAGSFGAYACGSKVLREYLINKSRSFIYTTAMPPAMAQASRAALKIIRQEDKLRRQLQQNADYLRKQAREMGFDTMDSSTPIIPILVKEPSRASAMSRQLLEKGIFVQAIRPPTVPVGSARLRLTVTALHTREDLDQLLNAFRIL
jgi:8-amino-7-oxononanoate synthase